MSVMNTTSFPLGKVEKVPGGKIKVRSGKKNLRLLESSKVPLLELTDSKSTPGTVSESFSSIPHN